jgi:hypothetical protein
MRIAHILTGDCQAFQVQPLACEFDVAGPDIGHRSEHPPAAGQLDLETLLACAELHEVVDEALHCERAVAGREPDRRIVPGARAIGDVLRQHEVIHAADTQHRIADTGGDTRSQHGRDDLIAAGDEIFPGQDPGGPTLIVPVPGAVHVAETR